MDDDEKSKGFGWTSLAWVGSILVVAAFAWTVLFGKSSASTRRAQTNRRAQTANHPDPPPPPIVDEPEARDDFPWVPVEPRLFVTAPPLRKRNDWLQIAFAVLIVGAVCACAAEAYVLIKAQSVVVAGLRPDLTVRINAIKRVEGEFVAVDALANGGSVPAINTQMTAVALPEVISFESFSRRAASRTLPTPVPLGVVLPGKPQVYELPVVAPNAEKSRVDQRLENGRPVTFVGRVSYQDTRGKTYQTPYCITFSAHKEFLDCVGGAAR